MELLYFLGGFFVGTALMGLSYALRLNIIQQKGSPGSDKIEFIYGEPYAILNEEEYLTLLKANWKF